MKNTKNAYEQEKSIALAEGANQQHNLHRKRLQRQFFQMEADRSYRSNIFMKVINYEKNKQRLEKYPHKRYLDLAIVYYLFIENPVDKASNASVQIDYKLLEVWEMEEDALYDLALSNMELKLYPSYAQMWDVLQRMRGDHTYGLPQLTPYPLYILTNQFNYFGAIYLYLKEDIKKIADDMESDLLIYPSSIHELIMTKLRGDEDMEELCELIKRINTSCVSAEDYLADHPYIYRRDQDEIVIPA